MHWLCHLNLAPELLWCHLWKKHTDGKGPELSRLGLIVYVSVVITDNPRGEESTGEVSIQVDLFTHPGTGEHKVTVKGKIRVLKCTYPLAHIQLLHVVIICIGDHNGTCMECVNGHLHVEGPLTYKTHNVWKHVEVPSLWMEIPNIQIMYNV